MSISNINENNINEMVIINIPGKWKTIEELKSSIVKNSDGYLILHDTIINIRNKKNLDLQYRIREYEKDLVDILYFESRKNFDKDLLKDIHEHKFILSLIINITSKEDIEELIDMVNGLLKAGGLVVEVLTSEIAYTKEYWHTLVENKEEYIYIYYTFASLRGYENHFYSVGMKTFSLPDVIMDAIEDDKEASRILNLFNLYHLIEEPYFANGHTLTLDDSDEVFKIEIIEDFRHEKDTVLYNPFGLIKLNKM